MAGYLNSITQPTELAGATYFGADLHPEPSLNSVTMAQIPQIPADIYRQVVRDTGLSRKDLCNLCLTSRAVSFEAYPALYANIALHHHKSTVSLIKTIQGSPELGSMIRSFTLRLRAPFADFYRRESQNLARSITLMTGLRNLHLDYPWGARDMTTTSCWTRNISLPSVKSISIETVTYSSVHLLFHQLPSPLPQYISIQRLPTYAIDGVNRLFCRNIYGKWTKLPHLESLVVWDLPFMPSDISDDVFPALHTFIVLQQLSVHTFAVKSSLEWAPWIRLLKSVKKLGPISYDEISGVSVTAVTHAGNDNCLGFSF